MHQKLLELLRCLSPVELNRLEKFLASPYFNTNERLLQLFLYLKEFTPHFNPEQMELEVVFGLLYPGKKFDKQLLGRLNSQLFKLVESFISHEQVGKDTFHQDIQLLRFYEEQVLDKHFQYTFGQLRKQQQANPFRDTDYFEKNFILESIYTQFLSKKDQRKGDTNLEQENECLDLFFIVRKLWQLITMLNRQSVIRVNYELTWMEELFEYLKVHQHADLPTISIYKTVLSLQMDPQNKTHYYALKSQLEQHHALFPPRELKAFYACLANAIKNVFPGKEYFHAFFELYQQQQKDGTLYHNGYILHSIFRNVVGAALGIGAFDWAEAFIQSHQKQILPESARQDAYFQMLANLRYYQGQAGDALLCLQKSNPQDVYYKLSQKSLLVKIYFDLRASEALRNVLNNFAKTITDYKSKIAATKVASYRKFINFTNELLRIVSTAENQIKFEQKKVFRDQSTLSSLFDLKERMEQSSMFYSKKWLLEKLEGLVDS